MNPITSEVSCVVPVSSFWYLNHVCNKEIKVIEQKHKVQMVAHVNVSFQTEPHNQGAGSPLAAMSEFSELIRKSSAESCSSLIPLKFVDPDQWSDAFRVIQKAEKRFLLTLTSEEITAFGPSCSQDAFSDAINAMKKGTNLLNESELRAQATPSKMDQNVKDLLSTKMDMLCSKRTDTSTYAANAFRLPTCERKAQLPKSCTSRSTLSFTFPSKSTSDGGNKFPSLKITKKPTLSKGKPGKEYCSICSLPLNKKKRLKCQHEFCEECLEDALHQTGSICPICNHVFDVLMGDQPNGQMSWIKSSDSLPGFSGCGHIVITYNIPNGVQTDRHPNPGKPFSGTCRTAYLPDNKEGNAVLQLLKKAFDQRLIFTVGNSETNGLENQVIWNDISHKTSLSGGIKNFGYPDPNYLEKVKKDLKAKGIKED